MALIYAGIALLADAIWPLAVLPLVLLVIDQGVIAREQRYLEHRFGAEYCAISGTRAAGCSRDLGSPHPAIQLN
jgi:hypothetical protein